MFEGVILSVFGYGYNVKPYFGIQVICNNIMVYDFDQALYFFAVYRILRISETYGTPGFYLYCGQGIVFFCDDIYFGLVEGVIAFEDIVPVLQQVLRSQFFSFSAEFVMRCHAVFFLPYR